MNLSARNMFRTAIIVAGLLIVSSYFFFRSQLVVPGGMLFLSILLLVAEAHTILHLFGLLYSLLRKKEEVLPAHPPTNKAINIFICVCGEPYDLVEKTIVHAKRAVDAFVATYRPKVKPAIYILNDGFAAHRENAAEIAALAQQYHVNHIARESNSGFKAGNINHALRVTNTRSPDETIDIVLDADFAVEKAFLVEILKPFSDQTVDFVQTPQRYQNDTSWVAQAAAAHQIFFFDHISRAKGLDNAMFLCGTNFAIKRDALLSVGGMDTRFITEDYATSLNLHLSGKKGIFLNKVLALGMAPSSLRQYRSQQTRWAKGSFDVTLAYLWKILFGPLSARQKFHYMLSATYYLVGVRDMLLILAPIPFLFFDIALIQKTQAIYFLLLYTPFLLYNFTLYGLLMRHPIKSIVLDIVAFPVYVSSLVASLFRKKIAFVVTIKRYEKESLLQSYWFQLVLVILLGSGLVVAFKTRGITEGGTFVNYFWALFNTSLLTIGFVLHAREHLTISIGKQLHMIRNLASPIRPALRFMYHFLIVGFVALFFYGSGWGTFAKDHTHKIPVLASSPKELLVSVDGVYYGYYFQQLNTHPKHPKVQIIDQEDPSLAMYYQDWGNSQRLDISYMKRLSKAGVVPVLTWEPWDVSGGIMQEGYSPKKISSGAYDDFIRAFANDAATYADPFFLRFAHEMNGNWYPWGAIEGNTPADYKAMWQHVYMIFREEGASNVLFVWSPNNTDAYGSTESLLSYYPGDAYVDWVGFSAFNWGEHGANKKWRYLKEIGEDVYYQLESLNKPVMISEMSSVSEGGDKMHWFIDAIHYGIPSFPNVKAVVFYSGTFGATHFEIDHAINAETLLKATVVDNRYYLKEGIFK